MNLGERLHRFGAVLLLVAPIAAYGGVSNADLQNEYGNKVLTLRQFYPGTQLHFDPAGKVAGVAVPGAWTVDGQLRVQDVFLKDGAVHIRGQRLFLFFDKENRQLRDVSTVTKNEKASKYFRKKIGNWAKSKGKVEIEVESGSTQPEMADVVRAMNAVFVSPTEPLTDAVPDFWKTWLGWKDKPVPQVANPGYEAGGALKVGGSVSAPHTVYAPDPAYSETARQAKYQGTMVLWLIVGADGLPTNIRIARPAGLGLDEQAVSAVQRWKFDPARQHGDPVPVQINVEVNFRLY